MIGWQVARKCACVFVVILSSVLVSDMYTHCLLFYCRNAMRKAQDRKEGKYLLEAVTRYIKKNN
ncbi:hypothetical protein T06_10415 [Trichinella sp. T6]|nr:hypothetical protein T06_10415 [Trichinella sp. T6]